MEDVIVMIIRNTATTQCLANKTTKKPSFYERQRSLTNKQIQENDEGYLDDIISGLYAARIEYLIKINKFIRRYVNLEDHIGMGYKWDAFANL